MSGSLKKSFQNQVSVSYAWQDHTGILKGNRDGLCGFGSRKCPIYNWSPKSA